MNMTNETFKDLSTAMIQAVRQTRTRLAAITCNNLKGFQQQNIDPADFNKPSRLPERPMLPCAGDDSLQHTLMCYRKATLIRSREGYARNFWKTGVSPDNKQIIADLERRQSARAS
jgi:hypothetical protein